MHAARLKAMGMALAVLTLASCSASEPGATASGEPSEGVFPDQPEPEPAGPYAPRNECLDLPGAKLFFVELSAAVRNRDADALLKLTSPQVQLDFGGGSGLTTFKERLADKDGRLWEEIEALLDLGCAHEANGDMTLPWYFAQPMKVEDPFEAMLVVAEDVPVLAEPRAGAKPVANLSWDLVDLAAEGGETAPEGFTAVETQDGQRGYIANDKLRSLVDYRLSMSPKGEGWEIVSFVAGD